MKEIPTTWDETLYIDGYPGKYSVIARRHGEQWYIAGVNAQKDALKLNLSLPVLSGQKVSVYNDNNKKEAVLTEAKVGRDGKLVVTMQPNGGFVIKQ